MNKIVVYLLLTICSIACTNIDKKSVEATTETIPHIDISSLHFPEGKMLLSDVAKDVEIIPLETTDKNVFDYRKVKNIVTDKENIFINVSKRILRFNRNGKYICDIGNFGQGPGDFLYATGLGLDETTKTIYVASNMSIENKIKSYAYDGTFKNSFQAANEGVWLTGDANYRETRDYIFVNGQHIFRRRLPLPGPTKENWQVMVKDTANKLIAHIYDPATLKHQEDFQRNSGIQIENVGNYWESFSPVMNYYNQQTKFLFEGNDTIYEYNQKTGALNPYYIVETGNNLSFSEMHVMDKTQKYFNNAIVLKDMLETRDFLYLVAEKEKYAYLVRVDKKSGEIKSKRREGEIKFAPIMQIHYREVSEPEFTNDLCGGLSFYPYHHNETEWIGVHNPEALLENIDKVELEKMNVILPKKRDELIERLKKMNEDDNPVLVIVKLKK